MSDISTPNNGDPTDFTGNPITTKKPRKSRVKKPKATRSAPWHIALQPLILQHTILPLLRAIIMATPNIGGPQALFLTFCSRTNAKVSRTVFNSWLRDLGITFRQTTTFSLPGTPPPTPAKVPNFEPKDFSMNDHHNGNPEFAGTGGGVTSTEEGEGFTMTNDVDGPATVPAQFSMAQAAHNANSPLTPDGIPTDQLALTPRLAALL